jgi:hypothetical protein
MPESRSPCHQQIIHHGNPCQQVFLSLTRRASSSHSSPALLVTLLQQQLLLLSAYPSSTWCLFHSLWVMPSMVAPSSPVQTPTLRMHIPWRSPPDQYIVWSSHTKYIYITYGVQHPWKYASSWTVKPGTFPGHSGWSSQSSAITCTDPGSGRAQSRMCCKSMSGFLECHHGQPNASSHSGSTMATTRYMNKLTQRIMHLFHLIGTIWQPNVHSHLRIQQI